MTDLGLEPIPFPVPVSVNNRGWIVGSTVDETGSESHGFLKLPHRPLIDLPTLGGESSVAFAINDPGQIAGTAQTKNGQDHAVIWTVEQDATRTLIPKADAYVRAGTFASANFGTAKQLLAKESVSPGNTRRTI
jgi:probable HAF family extracellular repeat protein